MITAVTTKKKRSNLSRFRRVLRPRQQLRCLAEFDEDELDFKYQKNNKVALERQNSAEKSNLKLVLKLPPISKADKVDVERHVSRPELLESTSGSDTSASEDESEEDEIVKPLKKRRVEGSRDLSCGSGQREESNRSTIRRPVRAASGTPMPKMSYLEAILDKLQMKDTYRVFAQPVNPEELPGYHDVIECPMDFGTVRRKLASRWYRTFEQFEDDVFLICSNAMHYNAPDTIYFNQAHSIQDMARSKFQEIRANQISSRGERKYEENIRPVHTQKNMEKNPQFTTAPKQSNSERSFVHKKLIKQNDCRNVLKPVGRDIISAQMKSQKTNFEKKHEMLRVFPAFIEKDMSRRPGDASYTEKVPRKPQYRLDPDSTELRSSEFSDKKVIRRPHFSIATAPRSSVSKKTQHRTDVKPPDADIQFTQSCNTIKKDPLISKISDTNSHSVRKKPLHKPHSKPECVGSSMKIKLEDVSPIGNVTSLNKRQTKIESKSFGFDMLQEKKIQKQRQKRTETESLCLDNKQVKKPQFKSNPESFGRDMSTQANKIQKQHPNKTVSGSFGSEYRSLKKPQSKRDAESFGFDVSLKKCKTQTDYPNESLGLDYRSLKKPRSSGLDIYVEKKTEMDHPRKIECKSLGSDYMAKKKPQSERDPESFGSYILSQDQKTQFHHPSRAEPESFGSDDASLKKPQSKGDCGSFGSYISSQDQKTQTDHPSRAELESLGSDNTSLKKPQSKGDLGSFGSYISSQGQKTQIDHLSRAEPESFGSDNTSLKKPQSKGDCGSFGSYISSQDQKAQIDHPSRAEPESLGSDSTSLKKSQSKGDLDLFGSYTSSQEKKTQMDHRSRIEPESRGSDFSSAETLASVDDTLTGLRKIQSIEKASCMGLSTQDVGTCTKFAKVEESVAVNISAEASSLLHEERSESEDDITGKSSPSKYIHSPIVIDINRRATYNEFEEQPAWSTNPIFDVLEDGRRELVTVSPRSEHYYARSLARFALSLGPIGWDIASQKIKQSLPTTVKFGPGWVGEHEQPLSTPSSSQNNTKHQLTIQKQDARSDLTTTPHSSKTNHPSHNISKPYTNIPISKAQSICFGAEKSNPQAIISGGWTQVQNGIRKNTEKPAVLSRGWNKVPKTQQKNTQLVKVKAEPNTDDLTNVLPTAYANMQNLPFQTHKPFSEINFSRTPQFGVISNQQTGTHHWSPRLNQQQAVNDPLKCLSSPGNILRASNTIIKSSNSFTAPTVQIPASATAKWKRSTDTSRSVLEGANTKHEFSRGVMDNSGLHNGRLFVFPDLNLNFQPPVSPTFASLDSQQPDLALQL